MAAGRTLHVRCATWDQVETFTTRKLRKGKLLSMKVPFHPAIGTPVTLGLELPNEVVIAIDGTVQQASVLEAEGRTWIEVELHGFTPDVVARIKQMASGLAVTPQSAPVKARTATPPSRPPLTLPTTDAQGDSERALFAHLTSELKRLRQAAVHEVLGVARDADASAIRQAWLGLVRRHHPDLVAQRKAPAITHLAEEMMILTNRAYDRLRHALVAEGRAQALGAQLQPPPGWLVGFEDISSTERQRGTTMPPPATTSGRRNVASIPPPNVARGSGPSVHGGETFETRARQMLSAGQADNAQEVLAAALVVYPRSRPLRSMYYVATAVAALERGEVMLATSQLETALAHYEDCTDASKVLDYLRRHSAPDKTEIRGMFQ